MIFAKKHQVANGEELARIALELFPDPRTLLGQRITLGLAEEARFDQLAGMMWPGILLSIVTEAYNQAGTSWGGFSAAITFSPNGKEVILTISPSMRSRT